MPNTQHLSDYERLVQLCNSYGLNQEETQQIITDFQNGSFVCGEGQSLDESLENSIRELSEEKFKGENQSQLSERQDITEQQVESHDIYEQLSRRPPSSRNEEYSFKNCQNSQNSSFYQNFSSRFGAKGEHQEHQKNKNMMRSPHNDSLESELQKQSYQRIHNNRMNEVSKSSENLPTDIGQAQQSVSINSQFFQSLLAPLLQNFDSYHKDISEEFRVSNSMLKKELEHKQQQIDLLNKIKLQDSDLIGTLKNTINQLMAQLGEKQRKCQLLETKNTEMQQIMLAYQSKMKRAHTQQIQVVKETYYSSDSNQMYQSVDEGNQHHKSSSGYTQNNRNTLNQHSVNIEKNKYQGTLNEKKELPRNQSSSRLSSKSKTKELQNVPSTEILGKLKPQVGVNMEKKERNNTYYGKHLGNSSKRAGIDINKYKGMIQQLRSSYQIR